MKAQIIKIIRKYQHTKLSNCFFTSKFKLSGMSHKSVNSLQLHRAMPCELIIQRKKKSLFNYSATFQRNRGTLTSISISCCAIKLRLLCNWRRLLTWGRMHRATSYRWARAGNKKKEFSAHVRWPSSVRQPRVLRNDRLPSTKAPPREPFGF